MSKFKIHIIIRTIRSVHVLMDIVFTAIFSGEPW